MRSPNNAPPVFLLDGSTEIIPIVLSGKTWTGESEIITLKGQTIPVVITVYKDKSFDFVLKTPPVSELIKKAINLAKGSSKPNTDKVGKISQVDVEEIAKIKIKRV